MREGVCERELREIAPRLASPEYLAECREEKSQDWTQCCSLAALISEFMPAEGDDTPDLDYGGANGPHLCRCQVLW